MNQEDKDQIEWANRNIDLTSKTFRKWKQSKPKDLDSRFHSSHDQEFKKMDCLTCANCCKTTSPIFRAVDIKRIAKRLKVKEQDFIKHYLKIDEDQDYVLKSSPCAFLDSENYCSIYEDRPLACREYPHTDRKQVVQINKLTIENTTICPAVAYICLQLVQNIK